jgi:hypothetical protein
MSSENPHAPLEWPSKQDTTFLEQAAFLEQVADMWSRIEGDTPGNESIWALKLRAVAASLRRLDGGRP